MRTDASKLPAPLTRHLPVKLLIALVSISVPILAAWALPSSNAQTFPTSCVRPDTQGVADNVQSNHVVTITAERDEITEGQVAEFQIEVTPDSPADGLLIGIEAICYGRFIANIIEPSFNFPANSGRASLSILTDDDDLHEDDGHISITLGGTGFTIGTPNSARIDIADNDPPSTIALSDLDDDMNEGESDSFTVEALNLSTKRTYTVTVRAGNSDIGFDSSCSVQQAQATAPSGSKSFRTTFTLHACDATGGTVTASLGGGFFRITDSQEVTVRATPAIRISGLDNDMTVGEDDSFTVSASNLNPSTNYAIRVTTDDSDIGFNSSCSDQQEDDTVQGSTQYSRTFTLYACDENGGTVSAALLIGSNSIDTDDEDVDVTESTTPPPTTTPEPTAPDQVGTVAVMRGNQSLEASWTAPNDGGSPITGYKIQHRESSATWPTTLSSVNASTTIFEISGLTNGTLYDVRVLAVNAVGDGNWSVVASSTPAGVPYKMARPTITPHMDKLVVDWVAPNDGGSTITGYKVQHKLASQADTAFASNEQTINSTVRQVELTGLQSGTDYDIRVAARNSEGYGLWSRFRARTTGALDAPQNLDVVPLPERKASLTWSQDGSATQYVVQAKEPGQNRWTNVRESVDCYPGSSTTLARCGVDLNLDNIINSRGLGHASRYQLQVRTNRSGSQWSRIVEIIDTPILSINGKSSSSRGKAVVRWSTDSDAVEYTLRYRQLDDDHTQMSWRPTAVSTSHPWSPPILLTAASSRTQYETVEPGASRGDQRDPLRLESIYAFQLNYSTDDANVFSARESYVWPSDRHADDSELVATFPLKYLLTDRTYTYVFCKETFPSGQEDDWADYVNHALRQWQLATHGLVTIANANGDLDCIDYSQYVQKISTKVDEYLLIQQLPHGALPSNEQVAAHARHLLMNLDQHGIDQGQVDTAKDNDSRLSEILMLDDPPPTLLKVSALSDVSTYIGYVSCDDPSANTACAYNRSYKREDGSKAYTSDIMLYRSHFSRISSLSLAGAVDGEILFNSCSEANLSELYGVIVHEAGHALGISGIDNYHTRIRDSVINYGEQTGDANYNCSPHPLDIMSIYALYQTAD